MKHPSKKYNLEQGGNLDLPNTFKFAEDTLRQNICRMTRLNIEYITFLFFLTCFQIIF